MDRFIENTVEYQSMFAKYLKSNMDRFIGLAVEKFCFDRRYLKSNMDRFIAFVNFQDGFSSTSFKIQYG